MSFEPNTPELRFATEAVRKAARLAQQIAQETAVHGIQKSDLSPVTIADFAAQAVVARELREALPNDRLVGEEDSGILHSEEGAPVLSRIVDYTGGLYGTVSPDDVCSWIDHGNGEPNGRFWTLDPIDGTKGYLRREQYATALALIEDGEVRLGVLGCPNLADSRVVPGDTGLGLFVAVRGQGTWGANLAGDAPYKRLHVSNCADIRHARLLRSVEAAHTNTDKVGQLAQSLGIEADPVGLDSQAKYAVLACGGGEILVRLLSPSRPDYRETIWDQAAGSIVVEEAGGRITDLDGKALDFSAGKRLERNRGVCATNGVLHDRVLEALSRLV